MVFSATDAAGTSALFIRNLGAPAATRLVGTEGAAWPFWSPDNRFIGFFAGGRLKKIAIAGGPAPTVTEVASGFVGSWSPAADPSVLRRVSPATLRCRGRQTAVGLPLPSRIARSGYLGDGHDWAQAGTVQQDLLHGRRRAVFSRRPLDGVCSMIGPCRGLRPAVPGSRG